MKEYQRSWKSVIAVYSAILLSLSMLSSAFAEEAVQQTAIQLTTPSYQMVALGDSLTVGYEPQMLKEKNPVPYGFVDRLFEQSLYHQRSTLQNFGIIGLTSEGLRNYIQFVSTGQSFKYADLKSVIEDPRASTIETTSGAAKDALTHADLITITIGGNDFGEQLAQLGTASAAEAETMVKELLQQYAANVTESLTMLFKLNPDVKLVIADQYQPMPKFQKEDVYNRLMAAADQFTQTIDRVAQTFNDQGKQVQVAHVAAPFKGREGELTHANLLEQDIHPTQAGYEVMAKEFAQVIWGDYRTPVAADPKAPINIVVKGQQLNTVNLPVMKNNRTYVAIKDIVDALGATTKWDNKTSSATITYGDRQLVVTIGAKTALVDGQPVALDAPAFLNQVGKEQKTYVPLRVIADGLGFQVENRAKVKTVFINL